MSMQRDGRAPVRAEDVRLGLSKWMNERCPEWTTLLTDHEVARLTRRPRCLLPALAFFGQLPAPERYHGKPLGWHRADIERWLATQRSRTCQRGRDKLWWPRTRRKKISGRARAIDWEDRHG
jgi:hypothetical protein